MNEPKKSVQFEVTTKTVTKVRIEFADGTYSELDDLEECRKWQQTTMQQATTAFVHGYVSPALNWKRGATLSTDGFIYTGKVCDCGHVHTKRYCVGMDPDGSLCICDEPSV